MIPLTEIKAWVAEHMASSGYARHIERAIERRGLTKGQVMEVERRIRTLRGRARIDVQRAIRLYAAGASWTTIGRLLAKDQGRPTPYLGESVRLAVRSYDRRRELGNEGGERT